MRSRWRMTSDMAGKVDARRVYTRSELSDVLGMSASVFAREIRGNSLWIAYGKTQESGKLTLYPGDEVIKHIERMTDGHSSADLFVKFMTLDDERFLADVGVPKSRVFADGTYIKLGGFKGTDW